MYELMVESQFSAAHQLRGYKGKCERLHGHNWRVQVVVTAEKPDEVGLVIDFHELKKITNEVTSTLDHSVLNEIFPFTEINPSSENIAKWLYDTIKKKVNHYDVDVSSVTVWESETASATYYE
jgi:6-pyruvoyltetrahydropterin/6-carboxytetrahydropterin synthase